MKTHMKRITALLLVLVLTAGQTAFASQALGTELVDRMVELAPGLSLVDGSLWSAAYSDLRTEHYLEYTPGSAVTPVLYSGKYVATTTTVPAAAAELEQQGWRVAAGVNGGFFNTDGTVVGMLMTDGLLRSVDDLNYTLVGFTEDGRVFVDESKLTKTVELQQADGSSYVTELSGFNAYRGGGAGPYLYNNDFASRVNSSAPCVYAILRPLGGAGLTMNCTLALEVVSLTDATVEGTAFDGVIPEGCYMLYAEETASAELLARLRSLNAGQRVTVSIAGGSEAWAQARYGLSAFQMLVRDGQVVDALEAGAAPRTALGLRADGSAVFYTIDGRQSGYSIGATYTQVAERLIELGCTTAVALDGGGSTTMVATLPASDAAAVVNSPSGGSPRAVNNSILFLTPAGATGAFGGFAVEADKRVVLSGARLAVTAAAFDTAGYPLTGPAPVWSAAGGLVEGSGALSAVYTAGANPGVYQITASYGGVQGQLPIRVIDSLTGLSVVRTDSGARVASLDLTPGDTIPLSAAGQWYNLPVAVDGAVSWRVDGEIGSIDENGVFTAADDNAMGSIVATAGGKSVTIPVRVDRGDPFVDMSGHWAAGYVTKLYKLGITTGIRREDGTYVFNPNSEMTRGELLVFLTRMLQVDVTAYDWVELPFADVDSIPDWVLPSAKAMYALQVFEGAAGYANVGSKVTREAAMTMMGRVLALQQSCDLSAFPDADQVSGWAMEHVQTLVALGLVEGSNGKLLPKANISRASAAKLLVLLNDLEKAPLTLRPGLEQPPAEVPAEGEPAAE